MNLPAIAKAQLPAAYEDARVALEKCQRIDECKTWKDKAAAAASYAKQARDESLLKLAMKIKGQASARCGELMREFDKAQGKRNDRPQLVNADGNKLTQREFGERSGLSKREIDTALQISAIPKAERDALIDSNEPPTLKELAAMGTKARPKPLIDLEGRDPADVRLASTAQGALHDFATMAQARAPAAVVRGSFPREMKEMLNNALVTADWCRRLIAELGKR